MKTGLAMSQQKKYNFIWKNAIHHNIFPIILTNICHNILQNSKENYKLEIYSKHA